MARDGREDCSLGLPETYAEGALAADTAQGLLEAADAAMYRGKEDGKNGIHMAARPGTGPRLESLDPNGQD